MINESGLHTNKVLPCTFPSCHLCKCLIPGQKVKSFCSQIIFVLQTQVADNGVDALKHQYEKCSAFIKTAILTLLKQLSHLVFDIMIVALLVTEEVSHRWPNLLNVFLEIHRVLNSNWTDSISGIVRFSHVNHISVIREFEQQLNTRH